MINKILNLINNKFEKCDSLPVEMIDNAKMRGVKKRSCIIYV
jgi:hypothetical protein